jgi:hypothetical protein
LQWEKQVAFANCHGEETMRALVVHVALLAAFSSGCATTGSVRYVYQDGTFGVIGMPENTNRWPSYFHSKAEKMMAEHFPKGYEIIRAEEVTEGSRTLKIDRSKTAEISPEVPAEILKIAKFGRTASRSQADVVKIKECRVIYRRADHPGQKQFSSDMECTPTRYIDPNDAERKKPEAKPNDAATAKAAKPEAVAKKTTVPGSSAPPTRAQEPSQPFGFVPPL